MYVVVTGGTKGIGRAIIEELASDCSLIATCSRNQKDLDMLACQYESGLVKTQKIDLSIGKDRGKFTEFILSHGTPDVLVNNAGYFIQDKLPDIFPGENLEMMLQHNFYSTMELTQILIPYMIVKQRGHIINVCSVAGTKLYMNSASYTLAKTLQLTYSRMLREYLKDKSVKVTSIIPGATHTNSWAGIDVPKNRIIEPEDVARVVKTCLSLGASANIEDIIIRPTQGDL